MKTYKILVKPVVDDDDEKTNWEPLKNPNTQQTYETKKEAQDAINDLKNVGLCWHTYKIEETNFVLNRPYYKCAECLLDFEISEMRPAGDEIFCTGCYDPLRLQYNINEV